MRSGKQALRRRLLAQRRALPAAQWLEKSDRLCQQLRQSGVLPSAASEPATLLAYFSTKQEPDLAPLFTPVSNDTSYRWGFPRCHGKVLRWHLWSPGDRLPLQTNRYGILEPHPDAPQVEAAAVDLILVPAIACDIRGYRLGYGGGFYDRLLAQPDWAEVPTVGIVFAEALLPQVPVEPWDRPLQMVCTDRGSRIVRPK